MTRRKNDFYPTPEWVTRKLLDAVCVGGSVIEPCSGQGHMIRVLKEHPLVRKMTTNDVDPSMSADLHLDARNPELYKRKQFTWLVTNPPFSQAFEILRTAHQFVPNIAMLCRLSFLEPTLKRGEWFSEHPLSQLIVLPRCSFTGDKKTDSVTCAWMVWEKYNPDQLISVVPRKN